MKKKKNTEINPIAAKYTVKVGFFKKLHIKQIKLKNLIKKKSKEEDAINLAQMSFDIVGYGLLGNAVSTLFGLSFGIINILAIGCAGWIIENKLIDMLKQILSSISIVRINS